MAQSKPNPFLKNKRGKRKYYEPKSHEPFVESEEDDDEDEEEFPPEFPMPDERPIEFE